MSELLLRERLCSLSLLLIKFKPTVQPVGFAFSQIPKTLFECAAVYTHLDLSDCWYCDNGRLPDVDGAINSGITPILLDVKVEKPLGMRTDGVNEGY